MPATNSFQFLAFIHPSIPRSDAPLSCAALKWLTYASPAWVLRERELNTNP